MTARDNRTAKIMRDVFFELYQKPAIKR